LLKDPAFAGMPPQLHFEKSIYEVGTFAIEFSKGIGASWGLTDYKGAGDHIYHEVQNNLSVIYALNELEIDYKNTKSFNKLHHALVEAYEAN
jgi:hypothetical protein